MGELAFKTLGGEGEDIVLIHGFGSDRLSWLATSPALMTIGRVHSLDLPAHGESSPEVGDGSPIALSARISAALVAKGITRAHLVGHSLGGGLALLMAADQPARVASVSLLAPAGLGGGVDKTFLAAYPELNNAEATAVLLRKLVVAPLLISKMMVQRVLSQLRREGVREAMALIASQLAVHESSLTEVTELVSGRGTPRLIVWGDSDTINPPDQDRLRAFGGTYLVVSNAAHLPHIENPKLVNDCLVPFLKQSMVA